MSFAKDSATIALYDLGTSGTNLAPLPGSSNLTAAPGGGWTLPLGGALFSHLSIGNVTIEREIRLIDSTPGTILELAGWGETEAVNSQVTIGWGSDRRLFVGWEVGAGIDRVVHADVPLPIGTDLRIAVTRIDNGTTCRVIIAANGALLAEVDGMPSPSGGRSGGAPTPGMVLAVGRRVTTADPQIYAGGGWLRISYARTIAEIRAEWDALHPPAAAPTSSEMYLVCRLLVGGVSYWYGDIDRADGDVQVDGELIRVEPTRRAFHPDRKIPRSVTRLSLRNADKTKNRFFRDLADPQSATKARIRFYVGTPGEGMAGWRPISSEMYVERIDAITSHQVDMTIVDRLSDSLGTISIPTLGEVVDAVHATMPGGGGWATIADGRRDEQLPVTFGEGWHRAVPLQDGDEPASRSGAGGHWRWILGISLRPWHAGIGSDRFWWIARPNLREGGLINDVKGHPSDTDPAREFILYATAHVGGRLWHVAYMHSDNLDRNAAEAESEERRIRLLSNPWLHWLYRNQKDAWVRLPYGAENSSVHDPASIIEEIQSYSTTPIALEPTTLAEVKRALRGRWVGGSITAGQPVDEVLGKICSSWNLDAALDVHGRLMLHTTGVSSDDRSTDIPAAPLITDQFDIVEGSYRISVPLGNERHGVATRVRLNGMPEYAPKLYSQEFSLFGGDHELGRRILKDVEASWQPLSGNAGKSINFLIEHTEQHAVVTCQIPITSEAMGLELGGWIRLTHFAGMADAGDTDRLYRIEGIEQRWSDRQVALTLLDMGEIETMQPWVLDDEGNWLRLGGPGFATVKPDNGKTIFFSGTPSIVEAGVVPGDSFWMNDQQGAMFSAEIVEVGEDYIIVDRDIDEDFSGDDFEGCWKILRSYDTAPDEGSHPGQYEGLNSANDLYGSLCDETTFASDSTKGAMDFLGDPGYEIYGE